MKEKSTIYWFEPIVFLFFGLFHLHRIWGLVDRIEYAEFWLGVMNKRGLLYFGLMGILAVLCIAGISVFFKNIGRNHWWRWIYIFGGGYVLFDLFAILMKIEIWNGLLLMMYDTSGAYWNLIWGFFVVLGMLSIIFGLYIVKIMRRTE